MKNVDLKDHGKNNLVSIGGVKKGKLIVVIKGNGNSVTIGDISVRAQLRIVISGDGNKIQIDDRCLIEGLIMSSGGSSVFVGEEVTAQYFNLISQEGRKISIGRRCMFARDVHVRNSDAHSIFDLKTRARINHAKDTIIDEHVWLAHGVQIMRGVWIGKNSIVGTRSVVTKGKGEQNVVHAGVPATIIKEGVIWDRWFGEDLDDPALSDYLSEYV